MKKNQPSHSQKTLVKKPVQHSSRVASKTTKLTLIPEEKQQSEVLLTKDASDVTTNSMRPLTEHEKTGNTRQEKSTFTSLPSQREKIILSEKQITKLISHNKLEQGFRKDIYRHCQIVYGDKKALQEQIKEIRRNPAIAEDVSWQIALNPGNFFKLAGTNICGIKNEERRNAEEDIVALCEAINQYGTIVKYTRDCLSQFPNSELRRYERLMDREKMDKILQSPHHSEREKGPLSNAEVVDMVQQDSKVQKYQARIHYWSKVIFGNKDALQKQTEILLQDPSTKGALIQQLEVDPQSFHALSGVNLCGIKNKARKNAETSLSHMLDSVNSFANAAEQARQSILQKHQAQQRHRDLSMESAEGLHKQQDLSEGSECLSAAMHREVPETSRRTHERTQSSRKKALVFAS
ncbi:BID domain-containing T4SS effector [Bartonella sp. B39]